MTWAGFNLIVLVLLMFVTVAGVVATVAASRWVKAHPGLPDAARRKLRYSIALTVVVTACSAAQVVIRLVLR